MSMKAMTILQFLETSGVYLLLTVFMPAAVFGKKLRKRRLTERFLFYFITGNFYIINLVFVLQLLHISNRVTLIIGTVVPAAIVWAKCRKVLLSEIFLQLGRQVKWFLEGIMGVKTAISRVMRSIGGGIGGIGKVIKNVLRDRILDILLTALMAAAIVYVYGTNMVTSFGYNLTDQPVHNYWINALSKNQIFVNGVYPYGYHCMIYYMHAVFDIDTYVILRVFSLTQTLLIHGVLLAFLKECCKSRFAPYIGLFFYILSNLFGYGPLYRYLAALPQEFGMMFILPSIYFAFAFFRTRKQELDQENAAAKDEIMDLEAEDHEEPEEEPIVTEDQGIRKSGSAFSLLPKSGKKLVGAFVRRRNKKLLSDQYLAGFAMSFSMTLAVHFYDTMIAGLFCVGVAVGFAFRFFRKKYFGTVVMTCVISVVIAVFPMAVAFATGTPLQGSLNWGMAVISGTLDESSDEENETVVEDQTEISIDTDADQQKTEEEGTGEPEDISEWESGADTEQEEVRPSLVDRVQMAVQSGVARIRYTVTAVVQGIKSSVCAMAENIREYVLSEGENNDVGYLVLILLVVLFGFGLVMMPRDKDYGGILVSSAVYMICLSLLQTATKLGLPSLMDEGRCSVYYAYSLAMLISLLADVVITILVGWLKQRWLTSLCSLLAVAALLTGLWKGDMLKEPLTAVALETNEAITCLTNIRMEKKDFTWTVCSANDELRMVEDHGYHYEIITFLRRMEGVGADITIALPTPTVYFFIEKVPLDYTVHYDGSGQSISREGAEQPLPYVGGLGSYQGENRWIVMSRMYYWAEEFRKLYPNEMKVYMETDEFVCYKVEQNMDALFNFAIDYGYNGVSR